MDQEPHKPRRVTISLRSDLNVRVETVARALDQNPNYFVNQCVEGVLDAIQGEEIAHDIPILRMARIMKGNPLLESKWVITLCSLSASCENEITVWHRRYFAEIANRHEGRLTKEFIELYWKQAEEMTQHRINREQKIARLKKSVETKE